jgi:hypothetical protein
MPGFVIAPVTSLAAVLLAAWVNTSCKTSGKASLEV